MSAVSAKSAVLAVTLRIHSLKYVLARLETYSWDTARRGFSEIALIGDGGPGYDPGAAVREIIATGVIDRLRICRDKIPTYWLDLIVSGLRAHFINRWLVAPILHPVPAFEELGEMLSPA